MPGYDYKPFEVTPPPELDGEGEAKARYPVAIIGAGPIGLAAAVDLATKGVPSIVLDDNNVVSIGSRAICWAKRTLEIFDRLGICYRKRATNILPSSIYNNIMLNNIWLNGQKSFPTSLICVLKTRWLSTRTMVTTLHSK